MLNERVVISVNAMATRFEILMYGNDLGRLRAASEEAIEEIERIEAQLSIYQPESEMSQVNFNAAEGPVRVDPRLFYLMKHAKKLWGQTNGAFDMSITPMLRAWGFTGDEGHEVSSAEIESVRELIGMHHVSLNEDDYTISFDMAGVELDPGAIGKGYAVERAADIIREVGITSALIHGGTSTVYAIGSPPDKQGWPVAVRHPVEQGEYLAIISLCDSSLSISAIRGKSFMGEGREYGHVIDPRNGMPTEAALTAAVIGPSPTNCDALSTALLVLGEEGIEILSRVRPDYRFLVAVMDREAGGVRAVSSGTG